MRDPMFVGVDVRFEVKCPVCVDVISTVFVHEASRDGLSDASARILAASEEHMAQHGIAYWQADDAPGEE